MKRAIAGFLVLTAVFAVGCAETDEPSGEGATAVSVHEEASQGPALTPVAADGSTADDDPTQQAGVDEAAGGLDAPGGDVAAALPRAALGVVVPNGSTGTGPSTDPNQGVSSAEQPSPEPWNGAAPSGGSMPSHASSK